MKFSRKLLLWTIVVMALAFGFSGFYFVNYVFQTALARETGQAMEESSILKFAFETAVFNVPVKYDVLSDYTIEQITDNLADGGSSRKLRILDDQGKMIYASDGFPQEESLLPWADESHDAYQIISRAGLYYIRTCTLVDALNRTLYLETLRDVTEVFRERALGFSVYRRVTLLMLVIGALLMHGISSWLTRPIRLLTRATRRMAEGEYGYRARKVSEDELGQLTMDFNRMAGALEENISKLEEEIKSREDFVAAFAHELKTQLTAIIGYADMLRSRRLDEEKSFLSANYIYTEGKRLEAMSFRLLDIMVTKRGDIQLQLVAAESLFQYLRDMYGTSFGMYVKLHCEPGIVQAEPNLIKSVLMNLIDNACKASEPGSAVCVFGRQEKEGYRFLVIDQGIGIPKEEQKKITRPFYMVDKSRSRSRNGAGLGLALCAEILTLHGSRLEIESELGKGTCMSFLLPAALGVEEDPAAAGGIRQEKHLERAQERGHGR